MDARVQQRDVLVEEERDVDVTVNSAFVYGRYRKLERGIPQTEWPCRECNGTGYQGSQACDHCDGSGYLYDRSVEQLVAPVVRDVMDGTEALFHGAGREDVDARMLGEGRPFVVEVKEPHERFPDVAALEGRVNEAASLVGEHFDAGGEVPAGRAGEHFLALGPAHGDIVFVERRALRLEQLFRADAERAGELGIDIDLGRGHG